MIQNNRRQFLSASSALFASAALSGTVRAAEVSDYQLGIQLYSLRGFDVTTALNTGMIDTVYSPPLGALALQWYVPLEHMTALPFVHSTGAVLISSRFFKKLPQDLTKILKDEFEKTLQELTVALRDQTAESVKLMQQQGLMVTPSPSGEPLNAFYRIHGKVASKMEGEMFSSDLLQRVYGILGRSR